MIDADLFLDEEPEPALPEPRLIPLVDPEPYREAEREVEEWKRQNLPEHLSTAAAAVHLVEGDGDLFDAEPEPAKALEIETDRSTPPAMPTLKDCIDFLAGRCNWASTWDGSGFNKWDAERGHKLADKPAERWSDWDRQWAYRKVNFYRRQLTEAGLRWEQIAAPPPPKKAEVIKRIARIPNGFGIQFSGLDQEEYAKVRWAVTRTSGTTFVYWKTEQVPEEHREYGPMPATAPLDSVSAASLREMAQAHGFTLGPGVEEAFFELLDKAGRLKELAVAVDVGEDYQLGAADLVGPPNEDHPEGLRPWGHQKSFVRYAETVDYRVLLADEPGTGKTLSAIMAASKASADKHLTGKWVVLCPNSVKRQWARMLKQWRPDLSVGVMDGQGLQMIAYDVIVANYDIVRLAKDGKPNDLLTLLLLADVDVLILDESHKLKNPHALRTLAVKMLVKMRDIPVRIALSGSPILNRVEEFIPQLEILGMMQHFGTSANFHREYVAHRRFKELNDKLTQTGYMCRTTDHHFVTRWGEFMSLDRAVEYGLPRNLLAADDVAGIQSWCHHQGWVFLPGALKLQGRLPNPAPTELDDWAAYEKEHREVERWLRELALEYGDTDGTILARWMKAKILVWLNKLRQKIAIRKMQEALPYIEELLMEGEKVVVAVWHEAVAERLMSHFKGAALISGQNASVRVRDEEKQKFIEDPNCKVLVLQILSGGEGLDGLQDAAHHIVFLEYPWNPGTLDQAERRLYRGGQRRQVICHYVVANPERMSTIDQYMLDLIDKKKGTTTAAMHGADAPEDDMLMSVVNKFLGREEAA